MEHPAPSGSPLERGSTVGPYTILGRLGSGGMGDVYRARDARLAREVAIKVVRPIFTGEPDRLARFRREARILASLNHRHIAAIYGLEDSGSTPALVMELIEGPTLAERIGQGRLPLDEALSIARQTADALEYAHEHGVVHRDLKPANVKVTGDGSVKVLDFGLARALETEAAAAEEAATQTATAGISEAGTVVGTAAYMSPEQASGKPVDRRTDVWTFGCLLYEMLTGERVFRGETTTDTLAAVMRAEPDWTRLPQTTPPEVRALLRRALQKEPRQRLQAIGDARIALEETIAGGARSDDAPGRARGRMPWLAPALAGIAVAAVAASFVLWSRTPTLPPQPVTRFTIALPPGQKLAGLDRRALAFSADGREIAYVATVGGEGAPRIYVRRMDTGATRPIAGTEGASIPFFSPDGRSLGFFADGRLLTVPVRGGPPQALADVASPWGADWSANHTIVFAPYSSAIQEVPDGSGDAPRPLSRLEPGENGHTWPSFLPGGQAFLFAADSSAGSHGTAVQATTPGEHTVVSQGQGEVWPAYLPSGHLVYRQTGNLMAARFDLRRRRVIGEAVQALANVQQYAVSASGSLAYVPGSPMGPRHRLALVDRDGTPHVIESAAPDDYYQPRLSPAGDRIVVDLKGQVYLLDLTRGTLAPFTTHGTNKHALWTRDGTRLIFMADEGATGAWHIVWQAADGSGRPVSLTENTGTGLDVPYSLAPDGRLSFARLVSTAGTEFWTLDTRKARTGSVPRPRRFTQIPTASDGGPQFSPDGHWLTYAGPDASGHQQNLRAGLPRPRGRAPDLDRRRQRASVESRPQLAADGALLPSRPGHGRRGDRHARRVRRGRPARPLFRRLPPGQHRLRARQLRRLGGRPAAPDGRARAGAAAGHRD